MHPLIRSLSLILLFYSGNFIKEIMSLGINYGQVGDNLPSPESVVSLLTSLKITKARIYDTNPRVLSAFANSTIELIVTVENQMLGILQDPEKAMQWVITRIRPYTTKITGIMVGNEIFTDPDPTLAPNLLPAMASIKTALIKLCLYNIQVSSPHSLAVLGDSFPPSSGSFRPEFSGLMTRVLQFLSATKAPFWINAYPYFAYKSNPSKISLDYALLNSGRVDVVDPMTKLPYDNMLYAQVDAVLFAMRKLGFGDLEVRVSETGWPSKGDPDEVGATLENAAVYNRNVLRRQMRKEGTPLRSDTRLEVYLFALFNEDMKPGPGSERNYGLYHPDESRSYNFGLSARSSRSSSFTLTSSAKVLGKALPILYMLGITISVLVILRISID